ncbi:MAG: hypothetical protein IJH12_09955 [Clostridia bacterium]|nr:hypothetical protein [Clostridia bacterium]
MINIARVLKKEKNCLSEQERIQRSSNKVLTFIIVLAGIVFTVDYVLVLKFIEIIKKL